MYMCVSVHIMSYMCVYVRLHVSVSVCVSVCVSSVCTIAFDCCSWSEAITGWNRKSSTALRDIGTYTGTGVG